MPAEVHEFKLIGIQVIAEFEQRITVDGRTVPFVQRFGHNSKTWEEFLEAKDELIKAAEKGFIPCHPPTES